MKITFRVWSCWNNDHPIQKINWNTMRRFVVCTSNFSYSSVCCHNDNWSHVIFQCSEKGIHFCKMFSRVLLLIQIFMKHKYKTFLHKHKISNLFKKEKHSMSSIWTSSMNRTPGAISALPSSLQSDTLALIWSRTSGLISPVSPEKSAKNPCVLELMTSISCRVTVCTTSFRFCNSPSGHWTNLVWAPRK